MAIGVEMNLVSSSPAARQVSTAVKADVRMVACVAVALEVLSITAAKAFVVLPVLPWAVLQTKEGERGWLVRSAHMTLVVPTTPPLETRLNLDVLVRTMVMAMVVHGVAQMAELVVMATKAEVRPGVMPANPRVPRAVIKPRA